MNQKISGGAAVALIIVAVALIAFFGYRYFSGGPNGDVTQQSINHWRQMAKVYEQQAHSGNMPKNGASPGSAPPSVSPGASQAGSR